MFLYLQAIKYPQMGLHKSSQKVNSKEILKTEQKEK